MFRNKRFVIVILFDDSTVALPCVEFMRGKLSSHLVQTVLAFGQPAPLSQR
jgi:hypothetical protein